jgi:hypothetical protein
MTNSMQAPFAEAFEYLLRKEPPKLGTKQKPKIPLPLTELAWKACFFDLFSPPGPQHLPGNGGVLSRPLLAGTEGWLLLSPTSFHVRGKLQRNRERITVHGLNDNHNKYLKNLYKLYKSAAISASTRPSPRHDFYVARVEKGMWPTMARLTLARKMATITP